MTGDADAPGSALDGVVSRHSGGVQGTRFLRAACPVCGRDTAGGNMARDRSKIALKPHKRLAGRILVWCPGSKMVVPVDR